MIEIRMPNCEVIAMYYPRLRDLREDADKTQKEIAALLRLPAATVGTRLARGRERLRKMLKEEA